MSIALEDFVKQLSDSGIIAPGKLECFIPPQAAPQSVEELADELVQKNQLTRFQAQEIHAGRAKSLILGNYTLLDKIGEGGMGQVFKAEHRRMDRIVALKMLPRKTMKDPRALARFKREVQAAAKLNHPNIVSAFDADEANGVNFFVMEFVEGSDLSVLVKNEGPLSVEKAVNYILQAAKGLGYEHKKGIIHRDIKPANLLLDSEGTVKILDVGLARLDAQGDDSDVHSQLTGTGAILGTVDFMSPEQALDIKHADARADIYSLGCTLYYLISGSCVYGGNSVMEKLLAHRERPVPSLLASRVDMPEQLNVICGKMLAKKVTDRYQSISELVFDLQKFVATELSAVDDTERNGDLPQQTISLRLLQDVSTRRSLERIPLAPNKASGNFNRRKLSLIGGGLLGAIIVLAGVIFKLQSKDGTLIVEVDQPDAVVQVFNEQGKVEITRPGEKGIAPSNLAKEDDEHEVSLKPLIGTLRV